MKNGDSFRPTDWEQERTPVGFAANRRPVRCPKLNIRQAVSLEANHCFDTMALLRFARSMNAFLGVLRRSWARPRICVASVVIGWLLLLNLPVLAACIPPTNNITVLDGASLSSNGVLISYSVSTTGTLPCNFQWTFFDRTNVLFVTNFTSSTATTMISRVFGPFDSFPNSNSVHVSNGCGGGDQAGSLAPPCGPICLSIGTPSTLSGTNGSGSGPILASSCTTFGTNTKWLRMVSTNTVPGTAIISTEGSGYDTILGVYTGSITTPSNLVSVVCNDNIGVGNNQSRLQFITQPLTNYWLAVSGTNNGALQVKYWCFQSFEKAVEWNFDNTNSSVSSPSPSLGSGSVATAGGTTALYTNGISSTDTNTPNTAWNTTNYLAQGLGNKTRGIQVNVSTLGFQNIAVGWDQHVSTNGSKYFRLQWSTNGADFADFAPFIAMKADRVFERKFLDLSTIAPLNNNSNISLRILSEFESTATGAGSAKYVTPSGIGYNAYGTVGFDMVTVYGTPIPALAGSRFDGSQFSFGVVGSTGFQSVVQTSTNLVNWTSEATNTIPYTFQEANSIDQRFYRTLSLP